MKILIGDVRETYKQLETNSIQLINTSPPYYNLRNYSGKENQIGIEKTQEEYIEELVSLFNNLKPKLKSTATIWLNLGDSIVNGEQQLIPERVALEMIKSGFKLINQVVWYKRSCLPCSAKRRFGIDYEKLFLFSLNKDYKFTMMKQPFKTAQKGTMPPIGGKKHVEGKSSANYSGNTPEWQEGANTRCVWDICPSRNKEGHFATQPYEIARRAILMGTDEEDLVYDPFHGLGTTMKVAHDLNRNYIGSELTEKYVDAGLLKWNLKATKEQL